MEGSCAQAVVSADRGRGSTGSLQLILMCLVWGFWGLQNPRAGRISQQVQFPVCRQGTGEDVPRVAPWLQVPQNPHPQCSLHVRHCSAPLAQHRLPELKCLLTHTGSLWTSLRICTQDQRKEPEERGSQAPGTEEDDSELQRAWGALIKEKEQSRFQKKSRLDNLPSLQTKSVGKAALAQTLSPDALGAEAAASET